MDIAPVGANSFAMRSFGRHIGVGCTALSRMNSLPQSRTPYGVLSLLALNLFPDRGRPRLQTAVLRPAFFWRISAEINAWIWASPDGCWRLNGHSTCRSEFIRDGVVRATHQRRTYRPLANEFAPTVSNPVRRIIAPDPESVSGSGATSTSNRRTAAGLFLVHKRRDQRLDLGFFRRLLRA